MKLQFYKYQGTGNDFVMIDDRAEAFDISDQKRVAQLCDRKFGIGADGLILLRKHVEYDFQMVYFNSDGKESSMCGNGGRCIVKFAHSLGLFEEKCTFLAVDGPHDAFLKNGTVHLKMKDVTEINHFKEDYVLDTGSPHYVRFVPEVSRVSITEEAHAVRYNHQFREKGINVNFVQRLSDTNLRIRTYERGVEGETLSCGTGVTAAALTGSIIFQMKSPVSLQVEGGTLSVSFVEEKGKFTNIFLIGPAEPVFSGTIDC